MPKFRKKPVVVEAIQFRSFIDQPFRDYVDHIDALIKFCPKALVLPARFEPTRLEIPTLEGNMLASNGDWIIKGISGEFYLCKPDIFEKTHEAI